MFNEFFQELKNPSSTPSAFFTDCFFYFLETIGHGLRGLFPFLQNVDPKDPKFFKTNLLADKLVLPTTKMIVGNKQFTPWPLANISAPIWNIGTNFFPWDIFSSVVYKQTYITALDPTYPCLVYIALGYQPCSGNPEFHNVIVPRKKGIKGSLQEYLFSLSGKIGFEDTQSQDCCSMDINIVSSPFYYSPTSWKRTRKANLAILDTLLTWNFYGRIKPERLKAFQGQSQTDNFLASEYVDVDEDAELDGEVLEKVPMLIKHRIRTNLLFSESLPENMKDYWANETVSVLQGIRSQIQEALDTPSHILSHPGNVNPFSDASSQRFTKRILDKTICFLYASFNEYLKQI